MNINDILHSLTAKAVMGTERARLNFEDIEDEQLQQIIAQLDDLNREDKLLSLAGTLWLYSRAGYDVIPDPLPELDKAPLHEPHHEPCPPCLLAYFDELWEEDMLNLLPEWIYEVYQHQYHIPFFTLTDFIDMPKLDHLDTIYWGCVLPPARTEWLVKHRYIRVQYSLKYMRNKPDFQEDAKKKLLTYIQNHQMAFEQGSDALEIVDKIIMPYTVELSRQIYRSLRESLQAEPSHHHLGIHFWTRIALCIVPTAMEPIQTLVEQYKPQCFDDVNLIFEKRRQLHKCLGERA